MLSAGSAAVPDGVSPARMPTLRRAGAIFVSAF
jgi:hypothetical protein